MQSIFTTSRVPGGQVTDLYFEKLRALQIPYEFQTVETSYGDTNILTSGDLRKPPLVLVHGYYSCAPAAIEALLPLQAHFRIFAIDIPGQPNLSAAFRPAADGKAYGQWLYEVLSRLHISGALLVGISYGGYIAARALALNRRKIAKAILLVPAGIVGASALQWPFKAAWLYNCLMGRKSSTQAEKRAALLVADRDDFAYRYLTAVLRNHTPNFTRAPRLRRSETAAITTPLYLVAAEKDVLYPGKRLLRRARRLFPSLAGELLLEGATHMPGQGDLQKIAAWILQAARGETPAKTG